MTTTSPSYGTVRAALAKPRPAAEEPLTLRTWITGIGVLVATVVAPAIIERFL